MKRQIWSPKGLMFTSDVFGTGFVQDPVIEKVSKKVWRIYYSARTVDVKSYPFYIDVEAGNPSKILYESKEPLLSLGAVGTFDDCGITVTSVISVGTKKYMYYCGWNQKTTVPYALSIGLAVADEGCDKFNKISNGPILDRSIYHPISVSAPCVLYDGSDFSMWFISFTEWKPYNSRLEPSFVINKTSSKDGISWDAHSRICLDSSFPGESFARPWVIYHNNKYQMWFSKRGPHNYRQSDGQPYQLGYAESIDGINWDRNYDLVFSEPKQDWASEMTCYASTVMHENINFMFYNGNGFGRTGLGYAILQS